MTILLAFAFLSGIVTILSPCILPVLPIVLSAGAGGKARPFGVLLGFIASFTVFTLTLSSLVQVSGIPPDSLRVVAVVFIVITGLVMLVPSLRRRFEVFASRLSNRAGKGRTPAGFAGGLITGFSLGLVWAPCVGPIMASVITLAVTQRIDGGAVSITLAYSLGTSIPMLAIMWGGRTLLRRVPWLSRNAAGVQRLFGALMILVGVGIGFGWDRQFQAALLRAFPNYGTGLTSFENIDPVREAIDARAVPKTPAMMMGPETVSFDTPPKEGRLGDYGPAPELVTQGEWFNTESLAEGLDHSLSMADLRGKVVIVDFWTYSCVNCVRTIPHLRSWYETYKDEGLVIIGVHTPEFAFERSPSNVQKAVDDLGVTWPVVLDNDYTQWRAYSNRYWPAHYFIDAEGRIRYFHFGEGEYDTSESVIRALLEEAGDLSTGKTAAIREERLESRTAETYLGFKRAEGFISNGGLIPDRVVTYSHDRTPDNGEWNLDGKWSVHGEYIVPEETGLLELGFNAKHVFLVVEPVDINGRIEVAINGEVAQDTADVRDGVLLPTESRLYQLVALPKPGKHVLSLKVSGELRLFAFTFG